MSKNMKQMRKVINKIRTKVYTDKPLSPTEEMFLRNIVAEDIKNNILYYKNSWNIIISDLSKNYTEKDFKTYFEIKSQTKKDSSKYDWFINMVTAKHMESILNKKEEVEFQLFKSKKVEITLDIESQTIKFKNEKRTFIKNYKLSDLPLFKEASPKVR